MVANKAIEGIALNTALPRMSAKWDAKIDMSSVYTAVEVKRDVIKQ